ncbi:hypothetical protein H9X78_04545 [Clostridium saudiense]|nr:hypothetical protein [Clostridium saudiense]
MKKKNFTRENIVKILLNDENLKGKIGYNEFINSTTAFRGLPWDKEERSDNYERMWSDWDDACLRGYLEKRYGINSQIKIRDALCIVERENRYHPIRDYLNSLNWDGNIRVDRLFIDYLGAEDSKYIRAVTRKILVAAIARVFVPGIKFDNLVVLVGKQGIGKSNIVRLLGKRWHSDSFSTVLGKESYEQLQNTWIVEMAELSAMRKAEVEAVKHFLSKCEDKYRVAYGRRVESFPRQCVFFATTNNKEFLNDKTGNRRYWPVLTGIGPIVKDMWDKNIEYEIDQVWAEALEYYKKGESLILDMDEARDATNIQALCTEVSAKEGVIREYLDRLIPENWYYMDLVDRREWLNCTEEGRMRVGTVKREKVCALEIWSEVFWGDIKMMTPAVQRELHDILRSIDGWKEHDGSGGRLRFGKEYGRQKAFIRIDNLSD